MPRSLDVAEAQSEPDIQPDRLLNDLRRKAVTGVIDFGHGSRIGARGQGRQAERDNARLRRKPRWSGCSRRGLAHRARGIDARRELRPAGYCLNMKGAGLAAPYSVPLRHQGCCIRQSKIIDPRHQLQGIATFLEMAEAIIEVLARGDHEAALAIVFAHRAGASQLTATSGEV
jgi:hypothetical protein